MLQTGDFAFNAVCGANMKSPVDRILVKNEGIEVQFSCGVRVDNAYVR